MRTGPACLALVVVALAGCDRPSPSPASPTVPSTPAATIQSISITGPTTLAPGEIVSFRALAQMSDGTTQDVTRQVGWRTFNRIVLAISPLGEATGGSAGEAIVYADTTLGGQPRHAQVVVLVLPPGTFRLVGRVLEPPLPLTDAIVRVTSGTGIGLTAQTQFDGSYRLYGVAGDIELQVTKPDYATATQRLAVTGHDVRDFALTPIRPPTDLRGHYEMTLTVDDGCAIQLPTELRVRRYHATVTQNGPALRVDLSGATFAERDGLGNWFAGHVAPSGIAITLSDGYYEPWPDLVERLPDGRSLMVAGGGTLERRDLDLQGTLHGTLFYSPSPPGGYWFPNITECRFATLGIRLTWQSRLAGRRQ